MSLKASGDGKGDGLVPPLRSDVRIEEVEEDDRKLTRIVDGRYARRVRLDRRGRDIVRLLDRVQTFQTLCERIAATGSPIHPEALRRVLNAFAGLGLLEGTHLEPDSHQGMPEDFAPVRLLIPEDLCFTCSGCGSCCVGVNVGPVGESIAEDIRQRIAVLDPQSAPGKAPFFSMVPEGEEDAILVCQTRNGACMFLQSDGLCRIHRRLGAQAKPLICRLFPYRFVWTPDGIVVGLQTECRDLLRASLGQPLREQEEELREILGLLPRIPRARSHLSLDGETTCSYHDYLSLEHEILSALVRVAGQGGWAMLVQANTALLDRCRAAPSGPPDDLRVEFYAFLRDVGESLMHLKERYFEEGGCIRFHTGNLDMVVEALRDAPLFVDRILSDEAGEAARFAHLVIGNFWRSRDESFAPPDLVTAAAEVSFAWFLTRALAVSRARQVHRLALEARDLNDAWVATHMLLRNHRVREAFRGFRDRMIRLFVHRLPELISGRARLEMANPQTDFYLF